MSKFKTVIPSTVTVLRILLVPLFRYLIHFEIQVFANYLFLFAGVTDLLDGYLARKFFVSSKIGVYLDSIADFLFIFGGFLIFTLKGFYTRWVLIVIVIMFGQFLVTSYFCKKGYDPLGKHYGTILYGSIGIILLFPGQRVYDGVIVGILIATAATLLSRGEYLLTTGKDRQENSPSTEGR